MIKSLNPNGGSARIAIAQIASDQTDPAAIEAGRADAVARARADGADIVAIGGESGLVDNASVTVATDDSVFNGDAAATLARFSRQATATGRPVVLAALPASATAGRPSESSMA